MRKSKAEKNGRPEDGIPEKISIYYITPCAAKSVAASAPVGEEKSFIDGTINMTTVFNLALKILRGQKETMDRKSVADMSPDSVCWSLSGTEKKYFPGRSLAIDGMDNVIEFLEKLELGQITGIDFLEMRACDQGCAEVSSAGNRFLTVERLEKRRERLRMLRRSTGDRDACWREEELHAHSGWGRSTSRWAVAG